MKKLPRFNQSRLQTEAENHSAHSQARSEHYHARVIGQRASGAGGIARIQALNPDDTRPQASTINTETMGPG